MDIERTSTGLIGCDERDCIQSASISIGPIDTHEERVFLCLYHFDMRRQSNSSERKA